MMKVKPVTLGKTQRMSFSRIDEVIDMPNLIEVQKNSYQWFLDEGLKAVFKDISSITDYQGKLVLDFIDYRLEDKPKYTIPSARNGMPPTLPPCGSGPVCSTKRPARSLSRIFIWGIFP